MAVTISGMFGDGKTYFAKSPVIIKVSGLTFPPESAVNVCRVDVIYNGQAVGFFREEMGNQTEAMFDISSALRTIWSDHTFAGEVADAQTAAAGSEASRTKSHRPYKLEVFTEYIYDGAIIETSSGEFTGGSCCYGGMTEMERDAIETPADADVSHLEKTNPRNGDASTKPRSTPELVGRDSITSWVDVTSAGTKSIFYPASATPEPDYTSVDREWPGHAPLVVRDSVPYVDFVFVNRRGAVETCSARMKEALDITVETKQYSKTGAPSFRPDRSLMDIAAGGRRSWSMSSGYQTREWAEWWTLEFLMARQRWMLYNGKFVPVTVTPAKKSTTIYDRTKQQMPSVEFTATLALEG